MNEELDLLDNNDVTGTNNNSDADNTDLLTNEVEDMDAIASGPYEVNVLNDSIQVVVQDPFEYDYSYIETTNQYLFCVVVLLVTYICLYIFNSLRNFFQRIGG